MLILFTTAIFLFLLLFLSTYLYHTSDHEIHPSNSKQIPGLHSPGGGFFAGTITSIRIARSASIFGIQDTVVRVFQGLPYLFRDGISSIWLGTNNYVIVMSAEFAKIILSDNRFDRRGNLFSLTEQLLGNGLVTSEGDKWRYHRKILTPAFHVNILKQFACIFHRNSKLLVSRIDEKLAASDDGTVTTDITQYIMDFSLSVMCEVTTGIKHDGKSISKFKQYMESFENGLELMINRASNLLLYSDTMFGWTNQGREFNRILSDEHQFIHSMITERRRELLLQDDSSSESRDSHHYINRPFLDILLRENMSHPDSLPDLEIRHEVNTFIAAGHDTTGAALIWVFYLLGLHLNDQQRVQQEIDDLLLASPGDPERGLTFEELRDSLPFTEAVLLETIRLYPTPLMVNRIVERRIKLEDYTLNPGTHVMINMTAIHRDARHWKDPQKFQPERFMTPEKRHPFSFIPFGAGSRNCIGQKFAMIEMKILVVEMLRKFNLKSVSPAGSVIEILKPTLRPGSPVLIRMTRRDK